MHRPLEEDHCADTDDKLDCRRGRKRVRRGATTIEMAFVAPFVIVLVFGSIEFTRMMMIKQALTNSAREGCRLATLATTRSHEDAEDLARERMRGTIKNHLDEQVLRVDISPQFVGTLASRELITLTLEVDCADVSWLPPTFFAGAVIRASASNFRE